MKSHGGRLVALGVGGERRWRRRRRREQRSGRPQRRPAPDPCAALRQSAAGMEPNNRLRMRNADACTLRISVSPKHAHLDTRVGGARVAAPKPAAGGQRSASSCVWACCWLLEELELAWLDSNMSPKLAAAVVAQSPKDRLPPALLLRTHQHHKRRQARASSDHRRDSPPPPPTEAQARARAATSAANPGFGSRQGSLGPVRSAMSSSRGACWMRRSNSHP